MRYGHVTGVQTCALPIWERSSRSFTDRLIRLVNDLLDLSRLEAGRMEFRLEPVSLEDSVGVGLGDRESGVEGGGGAGGGGGGSVWRGGRSVVGLDGWCW